MQKITSIASLLVIIMITSCNHNSDTAHIKKIVSSRGTTTEYVYGADGNIASSQNSAGVKTSYKFSANKVEELITDSLRHMSLTSNIFLDSKGLADSTSAVERGQTYVKTYAHDAEGHITESKDFEGASLVTTAKSIFQDGNQVKVVVVDSVAKPMVNVFLEYYPDKLNTVGYSSYGMKFLGADSKNLLKKVVQVLPEGDTMRTTSFVYHFDDKGRVSQKVTYDKQGMMADSSSYSYY